jgi:hypothetical protein
MKASTIFDCFAARDVSLFILPRICLNTPFQTNFLPLFLDDCV